MNIFRSQCLAILVVLLCVFATACQISEEKKPEKTKEGNSHATLKERDIELATDEFAKERNIQERLRKSYSYMYEAFRPLEANLTIAPVDTSKLGATEFYITLPVIIDNVIFNVDLSKNILQAVDTRSGSVKHPIETLPTEILFGLTKCNDLITLCTTENIYFLNLETKEVRSIANAYQVVSACPFGMHLLATGGSGFPGESESSWFLSFHSIETGAIVEPDYKIDTTPIQQPRFFNGSRQRVHSTFKFALDGKDLVLCNLDNVNTVIHLKINADNEIIQRNLDISGLIPDIASEYPKEVLKELSSPPAITASPVLREENLLLVYNSMQLTQSKCYIITLQLNDETDRNTIEALPPVRKLPASGPPAYSGHNKS
jgi:hypothetical protein